MLTVKSFFHAPVSKIKAGLKTSRRLIVLLNSQSDIMKWFQYGNIQKRPGPGYCRGHVFKYFTEQSAHVFPSIRQSSLEQHVETSVITPILKTSSPQDEMVICPIIICAVEVL